AVLDTSVLVRYLTRDDAVKADAARSFIAAAGDGSLLYPGVATAELAFVLLRVYRWPPELVADAIRAVVTHSAIEVPDGSIWLEVADDIQAGAGPVDSYPMRSARAPNAPALTTFDSEITPIGGVECHEPSLARWTALAASQGVSDSGPESPRESPA